MKTSQMGLFYKAITVVSFLSIVSVCASASATTSEASRQAEQIGFRVQNGGGIPSNPNQYTQPQQVIDQPPVVIQGRGGNSGGNAVQNSAPVARAPAARAPSMRTPSAGAPSMAMDPVVEGFGDKVPLTVAIQQILPQGYGYTLGDGVDPGQLVSWRGGRPWNVVLQEMLSGASLTYSTNGRSVAINGNGIAPTIVMGTAPVAPVAAAPIAPAPVAQPYVPSAPETVIMPPQQPVVMQQPVIQQPVMMQPAPQVVMQPAPVMMQQPVMQQPVMMQPAPQVMMQPGPVMMQQPVIGVPQPAVQATGQQPLQIENPMVFQSQTWEAHPGQTLRQLLQEWCTRVGVELNWTAEFDYPIMASMNMTGTFEEAVRVLLTGFDAAKPTPRGRLHYNPAAGQSILIVEADGNHYGD